MVIIMEKYGYEMQDLVPIVAGLAEEYTGYEHSSVTYEKAQMLMEGVLYCIAEYESSFAREGRGKEGVLLRQNKISPKEACERGRELVLEKVKRLRESYNGLIADFQDYGLICLRDTVVKKIPLFFLYYDVKYAPQETVLTLDYPVLKDLRELSGADAVWEYLKCIAIEQKFLQKIPTALIRKTLREYHEEYEKLIENICGIVLRGILARLAGEEDKPLPEPKTASAAIVKGQTLEVLREKVKEISGGDREIADYLEGAISNIAARAVCP